MTPAGYRIRDRFTGYLRRHVYVKERAAERLAAHENAEYGQLPDGSPRFVVEPIRDGLGVERKEHQQ